MGEDVYFIVKEQRCLGHNEPYKQSTREYRVAQCVDQCDEMNREWRDIIIKKRSSGPTVGKPSERSMQLLDMCSYAMHSFRAFIQTKGFREIFDLDDEVMDQVIANEDSLLNFSHQFLKQILFGERTIPLKKELESNGLNNESRHGVNAGRQRHGQTTRGFG